MSDLPYERAAMKGEPIPSGLSLTERKLYLSLRYLYAQYYAGQISRVQASIDKRSLIADYDADLASDKQCAEIAQLWKRIEAPARAYTFEPTIENADRFYAAVYKLPEDWRCKRVMEGNPCETIGPCN